MDIMALALAKKYAGSGGGGNSGNSSSGENYSIEETVIGQWIDGKPIYRRVLQFNTPSKEQDSTYVDAYTVSDINIDTLISYYGNIYGTPTTPELVMNCVSFMRNDTNGYYIGYNISTAINTANNNLLVRMLINSATHTNKPVILTVEYTKTTDEATIAVATTDELNAAYEEGVQSA